jgi:hypothetical protein
MTWALRDAPVTDPTQVVLLIALGDRAHDDGTSAWPSVKWLAERARCSTRTVRRHMAELESAGLIRRGDQRSVAHLRIDRRPVVWDLAIEMVAVKPAENQQVERGDNLSGVTDRPGGQSVRGDNPGMSGVTLLSYKPSTKPSLVLTSAHEPTKVTTGHFETWWTAYPRKAGKGAARKAYDRASRTVGHQLLLDGALRFRADPNRDDAFTPHPATWLNGERWDDDPLPARDGKPAADAPVRTESAVETYLREMWQAGRAKAVADRSGLRYPQPDLPESVTTGPDARTWMRDHARAWIEAHHDEAAAAILGREAA